MLCCSYQIMFLFPRGTWVAKATETTEQSICTQGVTVALMSGYVPDSGPSLGSLDYNPTCSGRQSEKQCVPLKTTGVNKRFELQPIICSYTTFSQVYLNCVTFSLE